MDGNIVKGGFVGHNTLNLPILSAAIPDGWEKDCCLEYNDEIDYNTDADVIFIIGTSNDILHGYNISKKFRQKGKKLIHGGYQDTFSLSLMKQVCDSVYHGIPGPEQMEIILEDVYTDKLKPEYNCGINIDFPFDYSFFKRKKVRHIQFFSSVGCKFKCDYCCHQVSYDGIYKLRNIENVITDLKSIKQLTKYVGFRDPNFYNDRKQLIELCSRMIKEELGIRWAAQCPINIGKDKEVLTIMRKAGCRLIFLGLETLYQKNLQSVNKPFKTEEYRELISKIQNAGIFVVGYFMFGLDHDTPETSDEIFSFVRDTKISLPLINIYIPMPGTRLFERLKHEGRLDHPDLKTFMKNSPLYSIPCNRCYFTPKNISREDLELGYMKLFRKLTTYSEILKRSIKPNLYMFKLLMLNLELRKERIRMESHIYT
jgi:radical SAM superfamily enzyme YgiQ (UPF0313 family)